ncbi:MAG: hypothetical protein ACLTSX_04175 [Collinsella sp.]
MQAYESIKTSEDLDHVGAAYRARQPDDTARTRHPGDGRPAALREGEASK